MLLNLSFTRTLSFFPRLAEGYCQCKGGGIRAVHPWTAQRGTGDVGHVEITRAVMVIADFIDLNRANRDSFE